MKKINKHTFVSLLAIFGLTFFFSAEALSEGPPLCQRNVCAYFDIGADGGATIRLQNIAEQNQLCFLIANGRKTYFQLKGTRGPFRAGAHMTRTQYSWKCDNASPRPRWYRFKDLPPVGTQKIMRRYY